MTRWEGATTQLAEVLEGTTVEVFVPKRAESDRDNVRAAKKGMTGVSTGPEIVLRLLVASQAMGDVGSPPEWARLVRNALIHEGRLHSLAEKNPSLDIDSLLSFLVVAFERLGSSLTGLPSGQFSEAELGELEDEGVRLVDQRLGGSQSAAKTAVEYAALLATALSVSQAAALLQVDESRIRQRLTKRTLYGVKVGAAWRLPQFQFVGGQEVRGLDQVIAELPDGLHPIAVGRWLTTPLAELELGDEVVTPIEWLLAGGEVAPLIEIAHDL